MLNILNCNSILCNLFCSTHFKLHFSLSFLLTLTVKYVNDLFLSLEVRFFFRFPVGEKKKIPLVGILTEEVKGCSGTPQILNMAATN